MRRSPCRHPIVSIEAIRRAAAIFSRLSLFRLARVLMECRCVIDRSHRQFSILFLLFLVRKVFQLRMIPAGHSWLTHGVSCCLLPRRGVSLSQGPGGVGYKHVLALVRVRQGEPILSPYDAVCTGGGEGMGREGIGAKGCVLQKLERHQRCSTARRTTARSGPIPRLCRVRKKGGWRGE